MNVFLVVYLSLIFLLDCMCMYVGIDVMLDSSMPVSCQMCCVTDVVESID